MHGMTQVTTPKKYYVNEGQIGMSPKGCCVAALRSPVSFLDLFGPITRAIKRHYVITSPANTQVWTSAFILSQRSTEGVWNKPHFLLSYFQIVRSLKTVLHLLPQISKFAKNAYLGVGSSSTNFNF